jgi:hypothetical protein
LPKQLTNDRRCRMSRKAALPTMKAPALYPMLTGTRPVAGAVGACSLMLLGCSWFAFAPDRVGSGPDDVGSRAPVRIDDAAQNAGRVAPARTAPAHRSDVSVRPSSAAQSTPRRLVTPGARTNLGTSPVKPAEAAPPSAPSRDATKPAASTPAPQSAPITPPTLPAPTDPLPLVTLPQLPQLPQVPSVPLPDLATTTTPLGLP